MLLVRNEKRKIHVWGFKKKKVNIFMKLPPLQQLNKIMYQSCFELVVQGKGELVFVGWNNGLNQYQHILEANTTEKAGDKS